MKNLHKEYKWQGHNIIVDVADLGEAYYQRYECMAMYASGLEIECVTTDDLENAERIYNRMLRDYPEGEKPLTGKWAKLRDDLTIALIYGRTAEIKQYEKDGGDMGTCNLDAAWIAFPKGTRKALVEQAARESGTRCFEWELGRKHFVFIPDTRAQGNPRAANAEAMAKALCELGYDAGTYCQMD